MKKLLYLIFLLPLSLFGQSAITVNSNARVSATTLGPLFADDFTRANGAVGSNYAVTGFSGTPSATIVSNKLVMTGVTSGFNNYITYDAYYSCLRDATVELDYIANDKSATSNGLFVQLTGMAPTPIHTQIWIYQVSTGGLQVQIWRNAVNQNQSSASLTFTAGNRILVNITFSEFGGTVSLRNASANTEVIHNWTFPIANTTVTTTNLFKFSLGSVGGTQTVSKFAITRNTPKRPKFCFIGNSILQGYSVSRIQNRWANMVCKDPRNTLVVAGLQSCGVNEILLCLPELVALNAENYVLAEAFGNDLNQSISSSVWGPTYQTIVAALRATGARIVHTSPTARNGHDQSSGLTWLQSNYPSDLVLDLYNPSKAASGTTLNSLWDCSDGTHLGDYGNARVAEIVTPYLLP